MDGTAIDVNILHVITADPVAQLVRVVEIPVDKVGFQAFLQDTAVA